MVSEQIDTALENLLEKTLTEFIYGWYKNLSIDGCFPAEVRQNIRYVASGVLSRVLKINLGVFISRKIMPAVAKHIDLCFSAGRGELPVFHPALYNRKAELDYLRYRVKEVLPLLLEHSQLECSMFSVIASEVIAGWLLLPIGAVADVTVMNNLFLILTSNQPLDQYPNDQSERVEFLKKFTENKIGLDCSASGLHPDMCTILKDQSLLYTFMQFLKDQNAVHILQFCLDVGEFNKRMLTPELSSEDLDLLYRDAWDLYSVYFSPHSPDNIGFTTELVVQMRKVLSKDVTKLRTSPPLFQAYEYAYSLLDKNYCSLFHSSDEFYTWLCGPRTPYSTTKSGSSSPSLPGSPAKERGDSGSTVAKLSSKLHKIKGALRSQTVLDGHAFDIEAIPLETETEFAEELPMMEAEEERDMSAWKVYITNVTAKIDHSTGKLVPVYTISVRRISPMQGESGHWTVERRLADFYTLEAKLTEFHGDFPDTQLPPCGLLAPSPPTDTFVYEAYLQKLLSNSALRGSDLLHWFLSSPGEFIVEDNGFGKLFRKSVVPLSLRKERGQNIDPFIATYLSTTDIRTKSKLEWKDYTYEVSPRKIRCLTNTVFGNNLGISLDNFLSSCGAHNKMSKSNITGFSDSLLYIAMKAYKLPQPVIKLLYAVHKYLYKTVDNIFINYVEKKIQTLLVPQRIAHLIKLLQWIVYEKQTKAIPKEVSQAASRRMQQLKGWSAPFYRSIYSLLQQPILNKQLVYTLLDIVFDEIFPEKCMEKINET
ncbi:hypothetical protein AAG570_009557 [Ranatra chinensis]|uniref:Sorting nexin-14 n=1 Tax=Ranatra chinensis TaxID=642074 RepID=A0ABD0YPG6_9HEMI